MNALKKSISSRIGSLLMLLALTSAAVIEVKANKFDKGYLPPVSAAKARRSASLLVGTDGGVWRNRVRVATGDVNGDSLVNRRRNRRASRLSHRNRNIPTSHILPYIEQDNLYR